MISVSSVYDIKKREKIKWMKTKIIIDYYVDILNQIQSV